MPHHRPIPHHLPSLLDSASLLHIKGSSIKRDRGQDVTSPREGEARKKQRSTVSLPSIPSNGLLHMHSPGLCISTSSLLVNFLFPTRRHFSFPSPLP
jgi:hypothetical protein